MISRNLIDNRFFINDDECIISFVCHEGYRTFLLFEYLNSQGEYVVKKAEFIRKTSENTNQKTNKQIISDEIQIHYSCLTIEELRLMHAQQDQYIFIIIILDRKKLHPLTEAIFRDQEMLHRLPKDEHSLLSKYDCITWAKKIIHEVSPSTNLDSGAKSYAIDFDIRRCETDKVRFYLFGDELRPNKRWYNPAQWLPYSKKEILSCLPKKAEHIACKMNGKYGDSKVPLFLVEAPEWFDLVLYEHPRPKVSGQIIQKIIKASFKDKEILNNYVLPSTTWKWIIGGLFFAAAVVAGAVWGGIIATAAIGVITGAANLILVGLLKIGLSYFKKIRKLQDHFEEIEPLEDKYDNSCSAPLRDSNYSYSEKKDTSPPQEIKKFTTNPYRLRAYINHQLTNYDRHKGYRRRWLGDQKNIVVLKNLMTDSKSDVLSPQEMLSLCKLMMEETTEIGQEAYEVFNNIKKRMIKSSEKYLPLVVAQFLQYISLLDQHNFDRLCECSSAEQKSICRIMQNIPEEYRTQFVFDVLCRNAVNINYPSAAQQVINFMFVKLPAGQCSPENFAKFFALADACYPALKENIEEKQVFKKQFDQLCLIIQSAPTAIDVLFHMRKDLPVILARLGNIPNELINDQNLEILFRQPAIGNIFSKLPFRMRTKEQLETLISISLNKKSLLFLDRGMNYYFVSDKTPVPEELRPILKSIYKQDVDEEKSLKRDTDEYKSLKINISIEKYFDCLFRHIIPVSQQMAALCMGLHPVIGKDSCVRMFAGPGPELKDPMQARGDKKVMGIVRENL